MQGMTTAARHFSENPEFRTMLDFYKKSHEKRFDAKKKELNDKIKETEEMLAKRKISKSDARFDLNYYNQELKKNKRTKSPSARYSRRQKTGRKNELYDGVSHRIQRAFFSSRQIGYENHRIARLYNASI